MQVPVRLPTVTPLRVLHVILPMGVKGGFGWLHKWKPACTKSRKVDGWWVWCGVVWCCGRGARVLGGKRRRTETTEVAGAHSARSARSAACPALSGNLTRSLQHPEIRSWDLSGARKGGTYREIHPKA